MKSFKYKYCYTNNSGTVISFFILFKNYKCSHDLRPVASNL